MDTLRERCLGLSCFHRKKVTLPKTSLASLTLKMDGWNTFLSFLGQKTNFQSIYLLFVSGYCYFRSIDILNIFILKLVVSTLWNIRVFETTTQFSCLMLKQKDAFLAFPSLRRALQKWEICFYSAFGTKKKRKHMPWFRLLSNMKIIQHPLNK